MKTPRLLARAVRTESGCVEIPYMSGHRYGSVMINGKRSGAHRAAWILANGTIPEGMCVCHRCDNPRCINLDHLFLGTMATNISDRDRKGRNGTRGENARTAKLTADDVRTIRGGMFGIVPLHAIAKQFNVSPQTIMRVGLHQTWRHI